MKKNILVVLGLLFCFSINSFAQVPDSVRIHENISVEQTDATAWIKRYQADIDKYIDQNRERTDLSCDVLFLGSSSINLWDNIENDLAPLKIIRRSYGGATIRDMIYNYDVIARGYKPKSIVVYVENDFCSSKEDITVGKAYDLIRVFIQKLRNEYPTTPCYILPFKPSASRAGVLKEQLAINALLEDYAMETPNVFYIDITKDMYNAKGKLKDIFKEDHLHMTQKGYDIWTAKIKPILMDICK